MNNGRSDAIMEADGIAVAVVLASSLQHRAHVAIMVHTIASHAAGRLHHHDAEAPASLPFAGICRRPESIKLAALLAIQQKLPGVILVRIAIYILYLGFRLWNQETDLSPFRSRPLSLLFETYGEGKRFKFTSQLR